MTTDERKNAARTGQVTWSQLIAYGTGGVIPIALFNIAGQLIALLGNISLGLSAVWLGAILLIPRLWDAFSDPIIGHLSDNTRTRWGRRRPYIAAGGMFVAVSFVCMWWVPREGSGFAGSDAAHQWLQLGFILSSVVVFYTACTLFEIPHGALGMEMANDYHERTRLFSSKAFFGNLFAMGTPFLIKLASLETFKGTGDLVDGMRYVSLLVAGVLLPLSLWWFFALREPMFASVRRQKKTSFWQEMRVTLSNKTFLSLVAIIFTLAMGFNFVSLFNQYTIIFYLYGGDEYGAADLLAWNGLLWGVTGVLAAFPLNWLGKKFGKKTTLIIAILLMGSAQLAKIICYSPEYPYLVFIPTVLLSAGMFMFFTLAASMVGDICDEDELKTGTRTEGSYYAVFWWYIKMGSAFAGLVMGALVTFTDFDEQQNRIANELRSAIAAIEEEASNSSESTPPRLVDQQLVSRQFKQLDASLNELEAQWRGDHGELESNMSPKTDQHLAQLLKHLDAFRQQSARSLSGIEETGYAAELIKREAQAMLSASLALKAQAPGTLRWMQIVEITIPLALGVFSIMLAFRYPLTEERCYEIKASLEKMHQERRAKDNQAD